MGSTASDSATAIEAVQRAMALVRTASSKLRNPLPSSSNNLTGGFLTSLLTPIQQQQTLLEFNPLDATSFAELATQAVKRAAPATQPSKSRTTGQDDFVKAVVAATVAVTAKVAQKSTATVLASQSVSQAATGAVSKANPHKFSLVKPSLQDVNAQLIDMWDRISLTSPSPELKKMAEINRRNLQQINNAIAPRAAAGRSTGATLGKLLQQIEELADEGIVSLVQGSGVGGLIEDAFGTQDNKSKPVPTPPPALVKLAEIVGDVWEQTFPSSAMQKKPSETATKHKPSTTSSPKTSVPAEEQSNIAVASGVAPAATPNPPAATAVANAGANAAPVDVYAIADGINEVLREQAWLAGVDLT